MTQTRTLVATMLMLLIALVVTPALAQQSGYYVLDGFGGVHAGGGAPAVSPQTPYFGFDAAEDIVYVPAGSAGNDGVLVLDAFGGVHAGGAIAGSSLAPSTPYFGFDIARGIAVRDPGVSGWERRIGNCTSIAPGSNTGLALICTGSRKVMGGGVLFFNTNCGQQTISTAERYVKYSGPSADNAWSAGVFNGGFATFYARIYAICVNAP